MRITLNLLVHCFTCRAYLTIGTDGGENRIHDDTDSDPKLILISKPRHFLSGELTLVSRIRLRVGSFGSTVPIKSLYNLGRMPDTHRIYCPVSSGRLGTAGELLLCRASAPESSGTEHLHVTAKYSPFLIASRLGLSCST